jgi:hypothetical protein
MKLVLETGAGVTLVSVQSGVGKVVLALGGTATWAAKTPSAASWWERIVAMAEVRADDLQQSLERFPRVEMLAKALYFWGELSERSLIQIEADVVFREFREE